MGVLIFLLIVGCTAPEPAPEPRCWVCMAGETPPDECNYICDEGTWEYWK
jgi:hypothetical protein